MTRKLIVSQDISLPAEAVTQTFAILAKRRVGKTYTASVMAEEMVRAGLPFVVLDPTGAWWGLRSSADGKAEGLPVVIIGGAHGDIPLEPGSGKVIAELVVDHPGFYIVDLSGSETDAEQDRFAYDFAARLYRYKQTHRDPLHVFIDEADMFIPQRPFPNQTKMLGAFETLNRRGGLFGIGMTVITQRPAVLNKNVLTQSECLIVLQTTAPQDQDAVDDWVKRNGTKEQRDTMMASLASLKKGEAWIWSPSWLETFKLIHIRERHTFNSSATPKAGEKAITPQRLAPVDLEQIRDRVAATIEHQKANDPAELKRQITQLQAELKKSQRAMAIPQVQQKIERVVERVEVPVLNGEAKRLETAVNQMMEFSATIRDAAGDISKAMRAFANRPAPAPLRAPTPARVAAEPRRAITPRSDQNSDLPRGERAILEALIQYPDGRRREQLTVLTGYKRSSRDAYIQRLREKGYVEAGTDRVTATDAGIAALPDAQPLPTGQALQEFWRGRLPQGEKKIFDVLVQAYPESVDRNALEEATGYKRSSRDAYLQRMSAKELVEDTGRGFVRASENLF